LSDGKAKGENRYKLPARTAKSSVNVHVRKKIDVDGVTKLCETTGPLARLRASAVAARPHRTRDRPVLGRFE
jgi:hypothetical protein